MKEEESPYGKLIRVIPISQPYESEKYEAALAGATNICFMMWPPQIDGKLTFGPLASVRALDMRGVNATHIPPEIALCKSLEYFDCRHNRLRYLPPELTECKRLKVLLFFEGNQIEYRTEQQLYINLRHFNANPARPFDQLRWSSSTSQFTLVSWSLISGAEAIQTNFRRTPHRFLDWDYRLNLVLNMIRVLKPSVFCVQEVDAAQVTSLAERMDPLGYFHVAAFAELRRDVSGPIVGVATFYSKTRFVLERSSSLAFSTIQPPLGAKASQHDFEENDGAVQVSVLRVGGGQSFFLVNAGVRSCTYEPDVLFSQLRIVIDRVDAQYGPAVICGSFDFEPGSPLHRWVHGNELRGIRLKRQFRSAFVEAGVDPEWTFWDQSTMQFKVSDYIFVSQQVGTTAWTALPSKTSAESYRLFPNAHWPSPHLPLCAGMEIRSAGAEAF